VAKWTKERIIQAIREAKKAGVDLSWSNMSKHRQYAGMAYAAIRDSRFGGWDEALEAAGVDPARVRRYESWDEAKILQRIKERARRGRMLSSCAMQQEDCRLFHAALKRFKSWNMALEAAGVNPADHCKRRRWDRAKVREAMRALYRRGVEMSAPAVRKADAGLYSAACKYFGSWTAARNACGVGGSSRRRTGG
jgi:hypothetical protein